MIRVKPVNHKAGVHILGLTLWRPTFMHGWQLGIELIGFRLLIGQRR